MERHWQHDLEELKTRLLWMGNLAERAVHQAVHAVLDTNEHLAEAVHSEEDAINEMQIEIDERVQRLLALQAPMATDLRLLLAVSRINGDLERIGDQALNIAHSAKKILRHPQVMSYVDLPKMSELAEGMVRDSLDAVVRGDQELAQSVLRRDDHVDRFRDQMFRELLTYMMANTALVFAAFELILVAKNLERIGDHATNIAEDVIYIVAGRDIRHPAVDRR
jgi:phosphate transport system protein